MLVEGPASAASCLVSVFYESCWLCPAAGGLFSLISPLATRGGEKLFPCDRYNFHLYCGSLSLPLLIQPLLAPALGFPPIPLGALDWMILDS